MLLTGPQVVEQFIHNQEQPLIGILLVELHHHVRQVVLVAIHLIVCWEGERQPFVRHEVFEPAADDVAETLLRGWEFEPHDLELPGDRLRSFRNILVLDDLHHARILGQPRNE